MCRKQTAVDQSHQSEVLATNRIHRTVWLTGWFLLFWSLNNGLPASSTASSQMTQLMLLRGNHTFVDQKSCIDDVVHVDSITIYRCSRVLLPHSEDPRWDSGQKTHLELMSGIKSGFMLMEFGFPGIISSYVRRCLTKTWFSCKEKQKATMFLEPEAGERPPQAELL